MFYLPLSPDEILAVHVSCFYEKMFFLCKCWSTTAKWKYSLRFACWVFIKSWQLNGSKYSEQKLCRRRRGQWETFISHNICMWNTQSSIHSSNSWEHEIDVFLAALIIVKARHRCTHVLRSWSILLIFPPMNTRILQSFHFFLLVMRYGIRSVRPDTKHKKIISSLKCGFYVGSCQHKAVMTMWCGTKQQSHLHHRRATTHLLCPCPVSSGTADWRLTAADRPHSEEPSDSFYLQRTRTPS